MLGFEPKYQLGIVSLFNGLLIFIGYLLLEAPLQKNSGNTI